jgi:hypothetical protein
VTDAPEPATTEDRLDDLRRRLYRADASDDDLRRYLAERATHPEALPPPEQPAASRSSSRRLVLGIGLAAAVVIGAAIVVSGQLAGPMEEAAPSSSPPAARNGFGDGVLGAVDGPTAVAVSIDGTAAVGRQYQGYGDATVFFTAPPGSSDGGRALVDVTSSQPSLVDWEARLRVTRADGESFPYLLARGPAQDHSGAHAPTTFAYAGKPLNHVIITAPSEIGWTLVIAVTPRIAPDLH